MIEGRSNGTGGLPGPAETPPGAQLDDPGLFRRQPWRAGLALLMDWGLIAGAFAMAIQVDRWPAYLLAAVLIARTQLALAVMMHEAAHGLLTPSRRVNDIVGQLFAAGPLCLSLRTYRTGHLRHHVNPMVHDDPVAVIFNITDYPVSRRRLLGRFLADITGCTYGVGVWKACRGAHAELLATPKSRRWRWFEAASFLAPNLLLAGALAWRGEWLLYLGLWVLPSATLLPLLGRIRAIMEHAGFGPDADQSRNARTIVRPSLQTFFFGPHAIHYHIEHHLFVRVPFYRLRDVHAALMARRALPERNLFRGYGAVLRDVTHP